MGPAAVIPLVRVASSPLFMKAVIGIAAAGAVIKAAQEVSKNTPKNDNNEEQCCCGEGRSTLPIRLHFIKKKSRKEAYEAARHFPGSHGVMYHPHNTKDNLPHFHPTYDYEGSKKIPGIHFQFPR
jgi:hypothetical protein